MKLRLKDDMDEKERVQEKNLESKLEASKKKTLDKNKMKLEQTISDLEVYLTVTELLMFKFI